MNILYDLLVMLSLKDEARETVMILRKSHLIASKVSVITTKLFDFTRAVLSRVNVGDQGCTIVIRKLSLS